MKDGVLSIDSPWESINEACSRLGIKPTDRFLVVRIKASTLQLFNNKSLIKSYVISTSRKPPSNIKGSLGTPRGLHAIAERIGAGQPAGTVFKARVATGHHFSELAETDSALVTTRILWLRGLEPGINLGGNVDTYERYVYIHGTHREERIGTPLSAGCVLMTNLDIIALYDAVRANDMVWIGD